MGLAKLSISDLSSLDAGMYPVQVSAGSTMRMHDAAESSQGAFSPLMNKTNNPGS